MNHETQNTHEIDFTPPKAVQQAAQRGLELKDEHGGKGLRDHTVAWARHLAEGKASEAAEAKRMRAYFRRHKVDKRAGWDEPPTPGYVAWLLWGGDAGQQWAEELMRQVEAQGGDQAPMADAKQPPGARRAKTKAKPRAKAKKAPARRKKARKKKAGGTKKAAGKKKVTKKTTRKKAGRKASPRRAKAASSRKASGRKKATARKASSKKASGRGKKASARAKKKTGARRGPGRPAKR